MTIAVVAIYKGEWSDVRQQITDMRNRKDKDQGFAKIFEEAKALEGERRANHAPGRSKIESATCS